MNTIFNETERVAMAAVILKLIAADGKYEKNELRFLQDLYLEYGIPLIVSKGGEICYDDAKECLCRMSPDKKDIARSILYDLANRDFRLDDDEKAIIERVLY